ncbi:RNA polymerase sigma factor [Haloferula chungangensis]|uniref:RNA polymerase sigma factor n=1 Tax=Haloferula chungangensis TaxID=1048331 RepID=A0ABW2KZW4_9BACT
MPSSNPPPTLFATTRWTLVVDAARGAETAAVDALGELVRTYWQPLYRYARRKGRSREDAEDLVQGFMLHLIEARSLERADREKGRFRAFLLACFNHWMTNQWRHATRQKRGGDQATLSIDWQSAETGLRLDIADPHNADHHFDREWALALLAKVLDDLEAASRADGSIEPFEQLKPCLTADSQKIPYARIAKELGVTEGAIRVAVHRLRKRYRKLLTSEITRTLASSDSVDDEMKALFAALSS